MSQKLDCLDELINEIIDLEQVIPHATFHKLNRLCEAVENAKDEEKVCPGCGRVKPVSEFTKSSRTKDGLDVYCRSCKSFKYTSWSRTEHGKTVRRRLNTTPAYKAHDKARNELRREQVRAQRRISYLIKKGVIRRPGRCEKCHCNEQTQAHHYNGYDGENALNVQFLCQRCHKAPEVREAA